MLFGLFRRLQKIVLLRPAFKTESELSPQIYRYREVTAAPARLCAGRYRNINCFYAIRLIAFQGFPCQVSNNESGQSAGSHFGRHPSESEIVSFKF